jgi:lysine 6-dehydrogenase
MKARILVLGTGLVGRGIAIDLIREGHEVTAVDVNENVLRDLQRDYDIRGVCMNFRDEALDRLILDSDLVVGASPGSLGFGLMKRAIGAGRNMVDISFCPEDFMELDSMARRHGVTVVPDMGVAPGMCNAILGYHHSRMEVESYRCMVGGLPLSREWPLEYKSSWSLMDCIEEYTRPARLRVAGKDSLMPALSDIEIVRFEGVGNLEAWNSDGLRSLLRSFPDIPDMVEKTLRYPGTTEYLKVLRELGFFSGEPVAVNGVEIRPVDLTAALLSPRFRLEKGEGEFTVMRITIEGVERGNRKGYEYELYDEYDPVTDTLSMARTTGYTCTGVAALLLRGMVEQKGIIPPERVAIEEENFRFLLNHLENRGIRYPVKSF